MHIGTRSMMELTNTCLLAWKCVNFFLVMPFLVAGCHDSSVLAIHVFVLSYDILNRVSQTLDGAASLLVQAGALWRRSANNRR